MSEISPETIRRTLALELGDNDSGEPDVRRYLLRLLHDVWRDGEGFNGKRPFGNSGWEYDLYGVMLRAGIVEGRLDSEGYVDEVDSDHADRIIQASIAALDVPQDAPAELAASIESVAAERDKYRDVLKRLADKDTWVLDGGLGGGLGGGFAEEFHVRSNLAAQALGLDVCGCTECQVSLGLEPEGE